jgi:hypothetical protein
MDWQDLEVERLAILDSGLPRHALEDDESMEQFRVRITMLNIADRIEEVRQLTRIADQLESIKRLSL